MSNDEYRTPLEIFKLLDDAHHFDLDAAATDYNALCKEYITKEEDALQIPWHANAVFCNPPYSLSGKFVARAMVQVMSDNCHEVIMLLRADSSTAYWQQLFSFGADFFFFNKRIHFLTEEGLDAGPYNFPSAAVVLRRHAGGKLPSFGYIYLD